MSSCNIIMATSCKGGVGKTTLVANLAITLAELGKRTLMLDCDFGMRCLDLVAGLEDRALYDVTDIISRAVTYERAIVRDERCEGLFFCAAPYRYDGSVGVDAFKKFIKSVIRAYELDYLLIDTHGGMSDGTALAAAVADCALIVATHQPASIRAAEQTNVMLRELGVSNCRLVINCFDEHAVRRGQLPGILEIIDRTFVRLIGVIPDDPRMTIAQRRGLLVTQYDSANTGAAFANIAHRLEGESIPLLSGFRGVNRKVILK